MKISLAGSWLCLALSFGDEARADWRWLSPELQRIDGERAALEKRLSEGLQAPNAEITQRLGWHSEYSASPERTEWVQLRFDKSERLDAVVLLAPLGSANAVQPGYGFPVRFEVELFGEGEEGTRTIIADYTREDFPNPGMLPVVIPARGLSAQRVRINATRLYREDGRYFCALGEVMLLSGQRNLAAEIEALGTANVLASSSQGSRPDWGRINIVDGQIPIGPPLSDQITGSLGYHSKPVSERLDPEPGWLSVDLGAVVPVDEVRLFPAHPPQFAHSHGYGFPVRYQLELRENESDSPIILSSPESGGYHALGGNNVQTIVGGQQRARFIRLSVLTPHVSNGSVVLALGELQAWSAGKNVALGKEVSANSSKEGAGWSRSALVDGNASNAKILGWPEWLGALSQRRELLQELNILDLQAKQLRERWRSHGLIALGVIAVAALLAFIGWLLRQRRVRWREMEALRERIARDLHDEIGSNLGSIALITQDILRSPSEGSVEDLTEIRDIAVETVGAMRDITKLIQSDRYGADDLAGLLEQTAARLLRTIPYRFESAKSSLPVDRERDLILMFKEGLHNVTRHSGASAVEIRLRSSNGQFEVVIHDNGCGFDPLAAREGMGLTNLQRRAAKHGGRVHIDSVRGQGATLTITLPGS